MSAGLADTSVFIANESGRPLRLEHLPDEIAATALTHVVPVVTQDLDYVDVPGLTVISV